MARNVLARPAVLALLASATLLLVAGAITLRNHSTDTTASIASAPPPPPPLHWTSEDLHQLLAAVDASRDEGLRPVDYRHDGLADAVSANRSDAATDALATDSARALAHDYAEGHAARRARIDWHIAQPPLAPAMLDADLAAAVKAGTLAAYLHGLLPQDARYASLKDALRNTPASEAARIMHIRASMERWRWMPRALGDDYVWVNVPTYELTRIHAGSVVTRHVVVVGAPKTPTPMLSATIGSVIINPWWTLPPTVLAEGKRYAPTRGFIYATIGGKTYVRQKPGPDNALGRVKINMPNPYAIYLHDTPAKWAFAKSERALSHGCIRVQGISTLAGDLTAPNTVADAMANFTTHTLQVQKGLPVYIVYFTAAPDADGKVVTYGDPYDRDAALVAELDGRKLPKPASTKRAWLTAKRVSATNGASTKPNDPENPGTIATY